LRIIHKMILVKPHETEMVGAAVLRVLMPG
jgi:hypothetical protein